jgi:ATP-dependent DNA helicase DinG
MPDIPALAVNAALACLLTADGELKTLSHDQAQLLVHKNPVLVCHAPYVRGRLGVEYFPAFDVLELFAFVHPVKFCVPTPHGLARALGIPAPAGLEDQPLALVDIVKTLLRDLQSDPWRDKADPLRIAAVMGLNGKGWPWTPFIFSALGQTYDPAEITHSKTAMNVWRHLPEWAEASPEPPPAHHAVTGDEARERLTQLLGPGAEKRAEQFEYTTHITAAFAPPRDVSEPNVVLAEAGTGIGKTLGYLAPASVWAEKNAGTVWISTYTKNLQQQIDRELDRLYPTREVKDAHVAIRKGRENYLCLLNLDEANAGASLARAPVQAVAAGLMTRWTAATKDGDLTGMDFPGWLAGLLGYQHTLGLADRRGECIYSACDHYHKCFVERSIRKSKRARLVVANHALAMIQSALSAPGEDMPGRYVFDEGHHLFEAADSAFSAHLSAMETRDLRRWILGPEGGRRSRARGLQKRAEGLAEGDAEAERALQDIVHEAACLTGEGWAKRLKDGTPSGPSENFLALVYKQVYARAEGRNGPYSLETPTWPLDEGIAASAAALQAALKKLQRPMQELVKVFRRKLADDEGMLDPDTRRRLDAVCASLERRSVMTLQAWVNMLESLARPPHPGPLPDGEREKNNEEFVDWMEVERIDGRAVDVGLFRHWVDPMKPFAASVRPHLHGMALTSATLRDNNEDEAQSWARARQRTGADYLTPHPSEMSIASPFDYARQTKIFIINDVRKDDLDQVAGAYRTLFTAAGGGALGLFTAIQRLRAVHERIALPLEKKDITLYAQHVDAIDTGTLVDIFRDDVHACLLGTDATRDGVDVPGESLRLIVFDRVPWPRPTILHKARREAFKGVGGKRDYDEMITRLKLKQAFGRLIRRADDKGVFVMLDPMLPSRLYSAFPPGAEVVKCGLSDAAQQIKGFLKYAVIASDSEAIQK